MTICSVMVSSPRVMLLKMVSAKGTHPEAPQLCGLVGRPRYNPWWIRHQSKYDPNWCRKSATTNWWWSISGTVAPPMRWFHGFYFKGNSFDDFFIPHCNQNVLLQTGYCRWSASTLVATIVDVRLGVKIPKTLLAATIPICKVWTYRQSFVRGGRAFATIE